MLTSTSQIPRDFLPEKIVEQSAPLPRWTGVLKKKKPVKGILRVDFSDLPRDGQPFTAQCGPIRLQTSPVEILYLNDSDIGFSDSNGNLYRLHHIKENSV